MGIIVMTSEQEIQKKNLSAELSTIRSEIDSEAAKLSEILLKSSAAEQSIKAFHLEKSEFETYKTSSEETIKLKHKDLSDSKIRSDEEIELNKSILKNVKDEIKDAIKELGWLNEKIINAEMLSMNQVSEKTRLDVEIANLLVLVAHKEDEEMKLKKAQESREEIENALETKRRKVEESVFDSDIKLKKMDEELSYKTVQRDKAESEYKMYTDKLYESVNDYQIIRSRLETRFKEHYPELELPLMA